MRVAFDEQIFTMQRRGGISRYVAALVASFVEDAGLGIDPVLDFRMTANDHARQSHRALGLRGAPAPARPVLRRWSRIRPSRGNPVEVVHHTYYDRRFLRDYPAAKRVITVHDMIPELFDLRPSPHLDKNLYVQQSDLILTNSESTRRDLIRCYGDVAAPVIVTHLGVDPSFSAMAREHPDIPGRYLLFVGARSGYKDFGVLIDAFSASARREETLLVAMGGGRFGPQEEQLIRSRGLAGRVMQTDGDDAALATAYRHCAGYVVASRYEGFGITVPEAMSCGAPVVVSDAPALTEVAADAAMRFPVGDSDALADVLSRLLEDADLAEHYRRRGLERSAMFTWRRTAEATAAAYRSVV